MKNDVKRITNGAILSALVGLLMLLDRLTGSFISRYYLLILPVILIVYQSYTDTRTMMSTSAAIIVVIFIVSGSLPVLVCAVFYIMIAWIYCLCMDRGLNNWIRFALMCVVIAVIYWLQIAFFSTFFLGNDQSYDREIIQSMIEMLNAFRTGAGLEPVVLSDGLINVMIILSYGLAALLELFVIEYFTKLVKQYIVKVIMKKNKR